MEGIAPGECVKGVEYYLVTTDWQPEASQVYVFNTCIGWDAKLGPEVSSIYEFDTSYEGGTSVYGEGTHPVYFGVGARFIEVAEYWDRVLDESLS